EAEGIELNISLQRNKRKKYDKIIDELEARYQNGRIWYDRRLKNHADTRIGLQQLYGISPGYTTKDDAPDADAENISFLALHVSTPSPDGKGNFQEGDYEQSENII